MKNFVSENFSKLLNSKFFRPNFLAKFYLALVIALQTLDLVSTLVGIDEGLSESNLVLLYLAKVIGLINAIILSKIVICLLFLSAYKTYSKNTFIYSSSIVAPAYCVVVMNNLNLIHI